jgi:hypothetical protein
MPKALPDHQDSADKQGTSAARLEPGQHISQSFPGRKTESVAVEASRGYMIGVSSRP